MEDPEALGTQITREPKPEEPTLKVSKGETEREAKPDGEAQSSVRYGLGMAMILIGVLIGLQVYTWVALLRLTSWNQRRGAESAAAQAALRNDVERQKAALNEALQHIAVLDQAYRDGALPGGLAKGKNKLAAMPQQLKPTTVSEKPAIGQQSIRSTGAGSLPGVEVRPLSAQGTSPRKVPTTAETVFITGRELDRSNREQATAADKPAAELRESVTPIARDHNEIEKLRKTGDREYLEFTLVRGQGRVEEAPGISLELRNTDPKRSRCALDIYADYYELPQQMSTNEARSFPIHDGWQTVSIELVITEVEKTRVLGYLSAPKGVLVSGR